MPSVSYEKLVYQFHYSMSNKGSSVAGDDSSFLRIVAADLDNFCMNYENEKNTQSRSAVVVFPSVDSRHRKLVHAVINQRYHSLAHASFGVDPDRRPVAVYRDFLLKVLLPARFKFIQNGQGTMPYSEFSFCLGLLEACRGDGDAKRLIEKLYAFRLAEQRVSTATTSSSNKQQKDSPNSADASKKSHKIKPGCERYVPRPMRQLQEEQRKSKKNAAGNQSRSSDENSATSRSDTESSHIRAPNIVAQFDHSVQISEFPDDVLDDMDRIRMSRTPLPQISSFDSFLDIDRLRNVKSPLPKDKFEHPDNKKLKTPIPDSFPDIDTGRNLKSPEPPRSLFDSNEDDIEKLKPSMPIDDDFNCSKTRMSGKHRDSFQDKGKKVEKSSSARAANKNDSTAAKAHFSASDSRQKTTHKQARASHTTDSGSTVSVRFLGDFVGESTIIVHLPDERYVAYRSEPPPLDYEALTHVLEISGFPKEWRGADLQRLFPVSTFLHWVDDTHVLAVFKSPTQAKRFTLPPEACSVQVASLSESAIASKYKASRIFDDLVSRLRKPDTDPVVVRRVLNHHLKLGLLKPSSGAST